MVVKSFRGQLAAGGQERISLGTIQGKVGYRIVKFQVMPDHPFTDTVEHVMKIYKSLQSTINGTVNFTDPDLLGAATFTETLDLDQAGYGVVIFDHEIFNQDIYITHAETTNSEPGNYYIELERIELTDMGAEYTTIKDMRANS